MKKIFFSLLAIAAIASCAKTEAVFTEDGAEIKLAPVTKLQTKANYLGAVDGTTYPTQENFDVYAYWKNVVAGQEFIDGSIFLQSLDEGGAEFTNKGNYWGGIDKYYWPKNGSLRFAAYSPAHLTVDHQQDGDLYTVAYEQPSNTAETWDFLVAPTSPSYSMMTAAENVAIEFQHALSWITLKVKAKDADAAQAFDIKKVTINGVNTKANFAAQMGDGIQYEEWMGQNTPAEYVVFEGSQMVTETATEIENTVAGTVVIPQETTTVTVDFDQYGVNGTADTPGMTVTLDLVLDTDNTPWEPGKHYIYNLIFGLDEILINPSVADWEDEEVGELVVDAINVSTAAQLEAALANPNATKIVFQNDIAGTFNVPEAAKSLTIDGNGFKFDGTFCLVGNSSYTNSYTVFQNLKFTAEGAALTGDAFIYCAEQNGNTRYPDNVTIQNCTFEAAGQTAVGVKLRSLNGALVIENTTATGLHSLAQLLSSGEGEAKINNVKVENCKNGISLQYTSATISNSTIKTAEYGVRADGCVATTNIVATTIEAKQPVIVRKVNADGYVLNVDDETTLTPATADDYQIIFTKGNDDEAYVAPTAKFTLNAATTYKVFPTPEGWVTNAEELAAALTADQENISVVLTTDIELPISSLGQQTGGSGEYKLGSENTKTINVDLNGHKLTISTTYWSGLGAKNDDVVFTIKNGTMTSSQTSGTWNSYDLFFSNCNYNFENVVFEKAIALCNATKHVSLKNVTIKETNDYYAMWITAKGQNIAIDGLTIESAGRGIKIDEQYQNPVSLVNLKVKNATFKTAKKAAIVVKSVAGASINLNNVNIAEVAEDSDFAVWVDEDSAAYADKVAVNGGYVKVEGAKDLIIDSSADFKNTVVEAGATVYVAAGTYTFPASVAAGATILCEEGTVFEGLTKLNINGATVVGATFSNPSGMAVDQTIYGTFKNCTFEGKETLRWCYTQAGKTVVFEDCVIKTTLRGVHFDGMDGDVIFKNCEINGFNAYSGAGTITFEGCTFGNDQSAYNGLNIYSNTVLKNCHFEFNSGKTNFIDMEGTGKTLTISGCTATLDGADANVRDFVGGSKLANNTVTIDGAAL